jgi:hypothetical protein
MKKFNAGQRKFSQNRFSGGDDDEGPLSTKKVFLWLAIAAIAIIILYFAWNLIQNVVNGIANGLSSLVAAPFNLAKNVVSAPADLAKSLF